MLNLEKSVLCMYFPKVRFSRIWASIELCIFQWHLQTYKYMYIQTYVEHADAELKTFIQVLLIKGEAAFS